MMISMLHVNTRDDIHAEVQTNFTRVYMLTIETPEAILDRTHNYKDQYNSFINKRENA